jgi:hypothetical protein
MQCLSPTQPFEYVHPPFHPGDGFAIASHNPGGRDTHTLHFTKPAIDFQYLSPDAFWEFMDGRIVYG